jgi:hypothetical protein
MSDYRLHITLLSDATFGRGDGVAGVVDAEVQHDEHGLPYLAGRGLKGLLGAECSDLVYALRQARNDQADRWERAGLRLFGRSGGGLAGEALLRVGPAQLPADLRAAIARDVRERQLTRGEVLETLTAVRRQTAMDPVEGTPKDETLRTVRVILRGTVFEADLGFTSLPESDDLALLAACVKALRRGGTGRGRGRGRLAAELLDADGRPVTETYFAEFRKAVGP